MGMLRHIIRSQKGIATFEFAGIAVVVMALAFGIAEFGSLIHAQSVVTNVTREGGSLASRDLKNGSDLLDLLEASTWPLNFSCPSEDPTCVQAEQDNKYKIYIGKINAGTSSSPDPTCETPLESGNLTGIGVTSPVNDPNCGLSTGLWNLLKYDTGFQTSPISQLTVVKVYYRQDPLTPLASLLNSVALFGNGDVHILNFDSSGIVPVPPMMPNYDSFLVGSQAIF